MSRETMEIMIYYIFRGQLQALYNAEQSLMSFEGQQMQVQLVGSL